MRSPRYARFLYEGYHNPVKIASHYEFAVGYPIYGELLLDGTYRIDGYLIRNLSYSVNISANPVVMSKPGNNQNAVPAAYVTPVIQGSVAVLEAPRIKAMLDYIQAEQ
jgi:hypothetical protein